MSDFCADERWMAGPPREFRARIVKPLGTDWHAVIGDHAADAAQNLHVMLSGLSSVVRVIGWPEVLYFALVEVAGVGTILSRVVGGHGIYMRGGVRAAGSSPRSQLRRAREELGIHYDVEELIQPWEGAEISEKWAGVTIEMKP